MPALPGVPSIYWQLNDPEWLRRSYLDRGRSMKDIAGEPGVSIDVVARARDRYGIPAQDRYRRLYPQLHDARWLRPRVEAWRMQREIAEEIGCTRAAVTMALRRHGQSTHDPTARPSPPFYVDVFGLSV